MLLRPFPVFVATVLAAPFAIFAQDAAQPVSAKPATLETTPTPVATPATNEVEVVPVAEPAAGDTVGKATVNITIPGTDASSDLQKAEENRFTVSFPGVPVKDIIRSVADMVGINVVIPAVPDMSKPVEFIAKEVTWKQIFKGTLEQINYTYVIEDEMIKLKSLSQVETEPMEPRTITVDHTPAAEMAKVLDPLIKSTPGAQILVDNRRGMLIVITRKDKFTQISDLVSRLDQPPPQVMIESKFVEVSNRDTETLGIDWSSLGGYELSAGPFTRSDSKNSGTTTGNSNSQNSTGSTSTTTVIPGGTTVNTASGSSLASGLSSGFSSNNSRAETAVFNASQFKVLLSALETNKDTKLVSNPTVVALNGTSASINIGEEYPIPDYTYNQERGVFEVSDFEYKPIGIILKVTPQVNRIGFINLEIEPEVSSRSDEKVNFGGAASANIPIINTRKTKSSISIKDSFTLAIGGLVERNQSNNESKVPFFGDLPLVGRLFTTKRQEDSVRNLIIFITAKTLNPDGSTYKDVFTPQQLYSMGVSEADAPGYLAPKDQQEYYDKVMQTRDRIAKDQALVKLKAEQMALEKKEADVAKTRDALNKSPKPVKPSEPVKTVVSPEIKEPAPVVPSVESVSENSKTTQAPEKPADAVKAEPATQAPTKQIGF